MHLAQAFVALVAALPLVSALPSNGNLEHLRKNNRITQVAAGPKKHGARAIQLAHDKYGLKARSDVDGAVERLGSRATSTASSPTDTAAGVTAQVSATDTPNDMQYLVEVKVGSQKMLLNFDTGSSDTWVFSELTKKSQQHNHVLYDLSGERIQGETWAMLYGDGSRSRGVVYADYLEVGGIRVRQAIEAATDVSAAFAYGYPDGLVGLGWQEGNQCTPTQCRTFMQNAGGYMPMDLFTVTLRHDAPGEYDFGYIDMDKYYGSIAAVTLTDKHRSGWWEFNADGYAVGDTYYPETLDAIADTGTSLILAVPEVVKNYYAAVPGAHYNVQQAGWIFPCSAKPSLPNFSVYLNGQSRTMPGEYASYQQLGPYGMPGFCYGGIQELQGLRITILGDVFLKSQFVVFDVANTAVGFAQRPDVPF